MRLYFSPIWSFTALMAPLFAILIGLGLWQIERLHWKLGLIAKIEHGLSAKPESLEAAYPQMGTENGIDLVALGPGQVDAADYRRVFVHGRFANDSELLFFTTGPEGAPVYHIVTPFLLSDGQTLLVDRGYVPINLPRSHWNVADSERNIVGILRKPAAPNWLTPPIDKAHRIVHTRDPKTLAAAFGLKNVFPMFLEADATPNPGGWPRGGQTVVNLPNDHLQYAITWFGLAAAFFILYFAYHRSRGRLGLKPPIDAR